MIARIWYWLAQRLGFVPWDDEPKREWKPPSDDPWVPRQDPSDK